MPEPTSPDALPAWLRKLPKAELHLHIEGTLEPEMMLALAARNRVKLRHSQIDAIRADYAFTDLQSFLRLYYEGAKVLVTEQDFHDLAMAYLRRAHDEGIVHVEIMFDPQAHLHRGVAMETLFSGLGSALREARSSLGISGYLLLSFLRHLSEKEAFATLDAALPLREAWEDLWIGVGLDSSERGNPPQKFSRLFARCRALGLQRVAHAGEEGPAQYVRDALELLDVARIDHGVSSTDDPVLMETLIREQTPLTVCPLSNLRLGVVDDLRHHNLARMLRAGVRVTINSDDPAYFGGYLLANYVAAATALDLSRDELLTLARNSLNASFLPASDKRSHLQLLAKIAEETPPTF